MNTREQVLNEYEGFWERKPRTRPILSISFPQEGATPFPHPISPEQKWLDEDYIYRAFRHKLANTEYLAEGFPMQFTNLGPGCLAACIGGSFALTERSVWFDQHPIVTDWEHPPKLALNEQSEIRQAILRIQSKFAADPETHFSITDLGGILDIVASLRGTQELLYDLYDYPDEVIAFSQEVKKLWFLAYDKQVELVKNAGQPYNNWLNIPSSKPWYPLQCDFCYMISPDQFRQFVLDDLVDQVNYMERSIYHLDGCGELPHLDMLLDIPNLTGIQWVASPGEEPQWDKRWFGLYQKIQDKKKNLVLAYGLNANDMAGAERLIKSIDPTGVCLHAGCSSRRQAETLYESILRWCQ